MLACVQALYDAADDDSATGGPDLTRRIFPVDRHDHRRRLRAAARRRGRGVRRSRSSQGRMAEPDGPLAPLTSRRPSGQRMPSQPRPGPISPTDLEVKERPRCQCRSTSRLSRRCGTRPTTRARASRAAAAAWSLQYAGGILLVAPEPVQRAAQDQRDLRPDRVRRGRPVQRVREPAQGRGPLRGHHRLPVRPPRRDRPRHRQLVRPAARHHLHREHEAVRGRDRRRRGRASSRTTTRSTGSPSTAR